MADQWDEIAREVGAKPSGGSAATVAPAATQSSDSDPWEAASKEVKADPISSPVAARTRKGRNGEAIPMIPEDAQVMGGPVLPMGAIIPSAVGYGASKLGEVAGLPDWANTVAGIAAGGLTGVGQSLISKMRSLPPDKAAGLTKAVVGGIPIIGKWANAAREALAPSAPEPFRPNPAVAAKMRFGGPIDTAGSKGYPSVGMSGAPEVAPVEPPSFAPVRPNPNIARTLRFTPSSGSAAPSSSPIPTRITGSAASDLPPVRPAPFDAPPPARTYEGPNRVNPNISRTMRYTPTKEGGGSAGPSSTLGTRAEMMRQIRLKAEQQKNGAK